jgi:archaellum component FlaC
MRAQINQLNAEHALIAAQLKTTRRDSQKADAALRSEIEAIRRACEKGAAGEQRARQKTLALQEAVKQAHAAASETEAAVKQTESELPALRDEEKEVERIHEETKRDLDRAEEEKEEALRADKKRLAELRADLATLDSRMEKLSTKRDKLRKDTLPSLEREIQRVGREVELVERDADGFEVIDRGPVLFGVDLPPQARGFVGAVGSQRNAPKPLFPALASVAPNQSAIGSRPSPPSSAFASSSATAPGQRVQAGADSTVKAPNSSLSSLAPPFDPTVGYVHRLNAPSSISSNLAGNSSTGDKNQKTPTSFQSPPENQIHIARLANMPPPGLLRRSTTNSHQTISAHNYTQSWDAGAGSGLSQNATNITRHPPSPARQASLPTQVPQFLGGKGRGGR